MPDRGANGLPRGDASPMRASRGEVSLPPLRESPYYVVWVRLDTPRLGAQG